MKASEFLVWIRDEVHCCPQSTEGAAVGLPSNGELKRWLDKGVVKCNNTILRKDSLVEFPITNLIFFPSNIKKLCTIL